MEFIDTIKKLEPRKIEKCGWSLTAPFVTVAHPKKHAPVQALIVSRAAFHTCCFNSSPAPSNPVSSKDDM
jgi:hypothetical protein